MVPSLPDRLPTISLVASLWQPAHGWQIWQAAWGATLLPPPHLAPCYTHFFGLSETLQNWGLEEVKPTELEVGGRRA